MSRERAPLKPGWVSSDLPNEFYTDTDYLKIISFFVFHAFRPNRSSKGKTITDYGWRKDVWGNSANVSLKDVLLYTADLHLRNNTIDTVTRAQIKDETIVPTKKLDEMSHACHRAGVKHDFARRREINRIAVYNSERNIMLSVFDHIRNSFAHGRFTIYSDGMIALESGKKLPGTNGFEVYARMLLKKDTLMQWIAIIEAGQLDMTVVKKIEEIRNIEKLKKNNISKQKYN